MKSIRMYSIDNYSSFEEAEISGAVYSCVLGEEISDIQQVRAAVALTIECIGAGGVVVEVVDSPDGAVCIEYSGVLKTYPVQKED